jgi:transcriptional antiterminator NusG
MKSYNDEIRWYALCVKQRYENIVTYNLARKGYEVFLPTYELRRQWSSRMKAMKPPLFAGYTFCRFDFQQRLPILMVPGVNYVVGYGKMPTPLDPKELDAVRLVADSGLPCEPCPFLKAGQSVTVERGPLAGLQGLVLIVKNSLRLIISINLLGRSVSVEIDRDCVQAMPIAKAMTKAS